MKSNLLLKVWGIVLTVAILSGLLLASVPVSAGNMTWTAMAAVRNISTTPTLNVADISPDGKTIIDYKAPATTVVAATAIGAVAITGVNTSGFTATGTILIGYGTVNAETAAYTAIAAGGIFTVPALANVHAIGESIIVTSSAALNKSTNSGASFSTTGIGAGLNTKYVASFAIADSNTFVALVDDTPTTIGYDAVYGSTDAGVSWSLVSPAAFGQIFSVDVSPGPAILIGGVAKYGIYKSTGGFGGGWTIVTTHQETTAEQAGAVAFAAGENVYAISFSPNYATDGIYVVVSKDTVANLVYVRYGYANAAQTLPLGQQYASQKTADAGAVSSAAVAFPSDFDISTNANFLVAVNSTGAAGGLWKASVNTYNGVVGTLAASKQINNNTTTSVANVAFMGTWAAGYAYIIDSTGAYYSIATVSVATNATAILSRAVKGATGNLAGVFASNSDSKVYIMSNGGSAALSLSTDNGVTFNGIYFITAVSTAFNQLALVDASTIFVLMGNDSILKYSNNAWTRVYYVTGAPFLAKIYVSPAYATDSTLYVTTATSTTYKSVNGGNTFTTFVAAAAITDMALVDGSNYFYVAGGKIYKSSAMYTALTLPAGGSAATLTYVSPTLIYAGGSTGAVYKSVDGAVFTQVGTGAVPFAGGTVYVAADATTLYAANNVAGSGVKSFSSTTSTWNAYGTVTTLLAGNVITQIALTSTGALYVFDSAVAPNLGIYRIADGANWQSMVYAPATGTITGMGLLGQAVYGFSTSDISSFTDTMAIVPTFINPATGTVPQFNPDTATISWNPVAGNDSATATKYTYNVSTTADMTSGLIAPITAGANTIATTSAFLPSQYRLINGMTYYVQVQITTPFNSKKSAIGSFQTKLTSSGNNPGAVNGMAPAAGGTLTIVAGQTAISPVFQWAAVANATSYEIKISSKADFSDVIDSSVGLTSTVYQTPVKLAPGVYYWELRAVNGTNLGDWIQSAFTVAAPAVVAPVTTAAPAPVVTPTFIIPTQPAPVVNLTVPTPTSGSSSTSTPPWAWVVIAIGAVLVIAVIVLIVRTRRV
jgi:hypothetical protein